MEQENKVLQSPVTSISPHLTHLLSYKLNFPTHLLIIDFIIKR